MAGSVYNGVIVRSVIRLANGIAFRVNSFRSLPVLAELFADTLSQSLRPLFDELGHLALYGAFTFREVQRDGAGIFRAVVTLAEFTTDPDFHNPWRRHASSPLRVLGIIPVSFLCGWDTA